MLKAMEDEGGGASAAPSPTGGRLAGGFDVAAAHTDDTDLELELILDAIGYDGTI